MADCHPRVLRHHTPVQEYPATPISLARVSAIVGGRRLIDSLHAPRTKTLVLGPLRLLLVIREWLGLRDLFQDAGTFPLCRAVV
jgi:hypothetical protein